MEHAKSKQEPHAVNPDIHLIQMHSNVFKYVVMGSDFSSNVMIKIQTMEMDVLINVKYRLDICVQIIVWHLPVDRIAVLLGQFNSLCNGLKKIFTLIN